jgi:hypothetical protein
MRSGIGCGVDWKAVVVNRWDVIKEAGAQDPARPPLRNFAGLAEPVRTSAIMNEEGSRKSA